MKNNNLKILFFGDVVGKLGRNAITDYLAENRSKYDFVIVNGENASHGFGLTQKFDGLTHPAITYIRHVCWGKVF